MLLADGTDYRPEVAPLRPATSPENPRSDSYAELCVNVAEHGLGLLLAMGLSPHDELD
jgi:hypothetical protein